MDIISSLPDPILCHILSFLSMHFSVQTSVLARRWRFLWTYVGDLHFDHRFYGFSQKMRMRFDNMVHRVLCLHKGSIDSLSIRSHGQTYKFNFVKWIGIANASNVQLLSLSHFCWLRRCRLNCETLVQLTIEYCWINVESGAFCLPRLRKLNLCDNRYINDESLTNLVSGCSTIEELVIKRSYGCDDMICCHVCSPTLKSLVLDFETECGGLQINHEHMLLLHIQAIQYLRIHDKLSHKIRAHKLSSVVAADISFLYSVSKANINLSRDMFQFFENLGNAKSLTFSSPAAMKLLNPTFSLATTGFHNLTKLELEADWHILMDLLQCAYKLESLTIRKVKEELKYWKEPQHLPECLLSSLKHVSIRGFAGREHELDMVRYILMHAKLLDMMHIYSVSRGKGACSKLSMLKRISYFPRVSQVCQLSFV